MIPGVILQSGGNVRASIWSLVLHAGLFAKGILLLLFVVSIWCWAVIGNRLRLYSRVEKADRRFLESFRKLAPGAAPEAPSSNPELQQRVKRMAQEFEAVPASSACHSLVLARIAAGGAMK